jgi:hypothetical protein
MHQYLPWRTRNDLRETLTRTLRKKAIGEYHDINADPFQIRRDNEKVLSTMEQKGYKMKQGVLVNSKWNRDPKEVAEARAVNVERYDLDDEESLRVKVPLVMSVEFMQEAIAIRATSLQIVRAALIAEQARRRGRTPRNLGLTRGSLLRASDVVVSEPKTALRYELNTDRYLFDLADN